MKIARLEAHEAVRPPRKLEGKWWEIRRKYGLTEAASYGETIGRLMFALKVTTDDGLEGFNYGGGGVHSGSFGMGGLTGNDLNMEQDITDGSAFASRTERLQGIWERIQGEDLLNTERLLSLGAGPLETCLWDLKGKHAGLPVHQLAGGAGRERIKAYASSYTDVGSPEEYADHAQECLEMGYQAYKLHTYRCLDPRTMTLAGRNLASPDYDIEACRAVRDRVGDQMDLMLDPDTAYTLEQAVRVGRELEKLRFKWFEAPMNEREHPERYAELRRKVNVPICGPESVPGSFYARAEWLRNGWTDIIRPGGGISPMLKCMALAQANHTQCETHGGGFSRVQAIATYPETVSEYYEMFLVTPGIEHMGYSFVTGGDPEFDRGEIVVPRTPGMGFSPALWEYAVENSVRSFELDAS